MGTLDATTLYKDRFLASSTVSLYIFDESPSACDMVMVMCFWLQSFWFVCLQVYYYVVDSPRNEGKDYFEINLQSGEVFTRIVFDREKQGAYALEVEARDGAPSARPNSGGQPNSGE